MMKYLKYFIFFIITSNLLGSDTIPKNLDDQYYKIAIESVTYGDYVELDTIDVTMETSMELGGFDLKLSTISNYYEIVDILKGDFSEKCNWEYFNKRKVNDGSKTWHIVSLGKMLADSTVKVCYYLDSSATLFKLVVAFTPITYTTPIFDMGQIRFKWSQCKDNTVSSVSGDTLMVYSKLSDELAEPYAPPEECYQNLSGRVRDLLIFKNGDFKVNFDPYQKSEEVIKDIPEIIDDTSQNKQN
ncbi:MAG: hypothetical protein U9N54_11080 [candidate division Zixibacteria bacterium]|nr:hypothetical protein [candidate division Zixibacteria bacterium]